MHHRVWSQTNINNPKVPVVRSIHVSSATFGSPQGRSEFSPCCFHLCRRSKGNHDDLWRLEKWAMRRHRGIANHVDHAFINSSFSISNFLTPGLWTAEPEQRYWKPSFLHGLDVSCVLSAFRWCKLHVLGNVWLHNGTERATHCVPSLALWLPTTISLNYFVIYFVILIFPNLWNAFT